MATKKFNAENLYFTADTHFGHKGILQHRAREGFIFEGLEEMNEYLITRWNKTIKKGDTVIHLGDFALCSKSKMESILSRLNGQIWFIPGNHDHKNHRQLFAKYGQGVYDTLHIKVIEENKEPQYIMLCHYPMRSWNQMNYGAFHLHGHCHGSLVDRLPRSLDVGTDSFQFRPVHYSAVKNTLKNEAFKCVDHHTPISEIQ